MNDILAALVELDQARVVHMDIKPRNILVYHPARTPTTPTVPPAPEATAPELSRAFVIDLGAAKPITPDVPERTHLRWTKYWFPQHLLGPLGFDEATGTILSNALARHWRQIDIYCCGRVFEWLLLDLNHRGRSLSPPSPVWIADQQTKEQFWRAVFGDDFAVVSSIVDRMLHTDATGFVRATDVKVALETIPLVSAQAILSSDLLTDRQPGIRIRTGDSLVRVSHPYDDIVEHRCFQRLRLLQQLAFVSEVFPDGTHNRFAHSLRTFDLAKRFVWGLNKKSVFRSIFQRRDVEHLLAAALIHDVGQYPFSHAIEDLRKMGDLSNDAALKSIGHDQEMAGQVMQLGAPGELSIADLLTKHGLSVEDVRYLFQKTPKLATQTPVLNISRDLIAGVIDVDRISYLVHDSERTGVPYGRGIDVDSLIEALTVHYDVGAAPDSIGLGIEESGISAVEAILSGVYWMYRNVYWRHTNRAFMAAIKWVMKSLLRKSALTFDNYWKATLWMSDWEALRYLRAQYDAFGHQGGGDLANPLADLAELRRIGYRRVLALHYRDDTRPLYDLIVNRVTPDREDELVRAIGDLFPRNVRPKLGQVLIDIPLKRRLRGTRGQTANLMETQAERGTATKVWVCCRRPLTKEVVAWVELADVSPLAARFGEVEDHSGRKIRIFAARSLLGQLSLNQQRNLEAEVFGCLTKVTQAW